MKEVREWRSGKMILKKEQISLLPVVKFVIGQGREPDLFAEKGAEVGGIPEIQSGGDVGRGGAAFAFEETAGFAQSEFHEILRGCFFAEAAPVPLECAPAESVVVEEFRQIDFFAAVKLEIGGDRLHFHAVEILFRVPGIIAVEDQQLQQFEAEHVDAVGDAIFRRMFHEGGQLVDQITLPFHVFHFPDRDAGKGKGLFQDRFQFGLIGERERVYLDVRLVFGLNAALLDLNVGKMSVVTLSADIVHEFLLMGYKP